MRLSRAKRATFSAVTLVFLLLAAEASVRLTGGKPWNPKPVRVQVEPGGRFYARHPTLGYSHIPGRFHVVLKEEIVFDVTHLDDTLRVTGRPDSLGEADQRPELWIFGGSITHGWGVDDEQTYPWLLQERFPHLRVVNFGVGGYGTIHSLIQLRAAVETRPKPRAVVATYANFHDQRNVYSRKRRKYMTAWDFLGVAALPFARLDEQDTLSLHAADLDYRPLPLIGVSALAHETERAIDEVLLRRQRPREVGRALLQEIRRETEKMGAPLIVMGLNTHPDTAAMLEFCGSLDLPVVDSALNIRSRKYSYWPLDVHPNSRGHKIYAERLGEALEAAGI